MDWFLLLLCVPAVVVPVVLLFGFAGCGLDVTGQLVLPGTPANLHAKLRPDRKGISLVWLPSGGVADGFEIVRTAAGEPNASFTSPTANFDDTSSTLKPGVTHHYTVKAVKTGQPPPYSPTGPSNDAFATMPPAAPVLTGQFVGANLIRLNWNPSPHATRYVLRHLPDNAVVYNGPLLTADHAVQSATHDYQIVAIVGDGKGFDDSLPTDVVSDPATVQITPPITLPNWTPIFSTAGIAPNPNNGVTATGDCIVQRIPAPATGGMQVRVTLRCIANQTTTLTAVTISKAAEAGAAQPQNSLNPPVPITFGGAAGVTLPINGAPQTSDPVIFTVTVGQDLHVVLDVSPTSGRILRRNKPGTTAYVGNNLAPQASQMNRPGNYGNPPYDQNRAYCIESVEVA